MTAGENILTRLRLLVEEGSMPRSACGAALLSKLRPLLDAGVMVEERSGAGRRLIVQRPEAMRHFISHHFPDVPLSGDESSRVAGVAGFRNSKTFGSDTPGIVSVRAWSETVLLRSGHSVGAAAATEQNGLFAFFLDKAADCSLCGPCALVENPAVFARFERLGLPVDLVLYGQGRLSNRIVDWLCSMKHPHFSLLHLPDYDPVGMSEHERLRARMGSHVRLHLPEGLAKCFARFSNPALLEKSNSRAMLATLRNSDSPDIRTVIDLIDRHNAGLEQEALLL